MTCKIDRVATPDGFVVLRVSGRIDGVYVATLRESMEKEKTRKCGLAIDLSEVTLVSHEAVEALALTLTDEEAQELEAPYRQHGPSWY